MVFLENLRKVKVCGNRLGIVYYDKEKQYEPELGILSRYFNRITLKSHRFNFIFKAWITMETSINIHISLLFFHRMKISMQNCDAYRANTSWNKNYSVWKKSIILC